MKLSASARKLLATIARTDEACLPLTKRNATIADELVLNSLAILIPKARGGADIALTREGTTEANKEEQS